MSSSDPFATFLQHRRADLRRIAAKTSGEHSIEDIMSEAWLMADTMGRRRGFSVDFLNKDDQDKVLAWLYNQVVRYADKSVRYAVKLDKDWDNEDPEAAIHALASLLTAPEEFDPAIHLQRAQDGHDSLALVRPATRRRRLTSSCWIDLTGTLKTWLNISGLPWIRSGCVSNGSVSRSGISLRYSIVSSA